MTNDTLLIEELNAKMQIMQTELELSEKLKVHYEELLTKLREKEEFNFALFQYSPVTMVIVDKKGRIVKCNRAKRHSGDRLPEIGSIMYKDYAAQHNGDMYAEMMECIEQSKMKSFPKMSYGNKFLSICIAPFPAGAIITTEDITTQIMAEQDRVSLISQLQRALAEVETLRGLLPLCASCKKIRDDEGYWETLEEYFHRRGGIDFSHTLCPDCITRLYPELKGRIAHQPQPMRKKTIQNSQSA